MDDRLGVFLDRMCTSHYWLRTPEGPRHLRTPLPSDAIQHHFNGGPAIGLCPITPGADTCQIACIDVDDHEGEHQDDMRKVLDELISHFPTAVPFTSSGGKGLHLYFLFEQPVKAVKVRKWLSDTLAELGLSVGNKGIGQRNVEIFPKQDSVAGDRYGNMFILPYSGQSKYLGTRDDLIEGIWVTTPIPEEAPEDGRNAAGSRVTTVAEGETAPGAGINIADSAKLSPDSLKSSREVPGSLPDSRDALVKALNVILKGCKHSLPYDEWRNCIFAIHDTLGEVGHELAHKFSQKLDKYDAAFLDDNVWAYADSQHEPKATLDYVQALARRYGPVVEFEDAIQQGAFIVPWDVFNEGFQPPNYLWDEILQKGCLYALVAHWGHGKTALMVTIALHLALGKSLHKRPTVPSRVLYLCGENPDDVRLRFRVAASYFGVDIAQCSDRLLFTQRAFPLDLPGTMDSFLQECTKAVPNGVDVIIIDTGPAHSAAEAENDNREMHTLAIAMRSLITSLGNPTVIALMHPSKAAEKDSLAPRGGGAFSGEIDGILCAWQSKGTVELFHQTKWRGPGFSPLYFNLLPEVLEGYETNFGNPVRSVVAIEGSPPLPEVKGKWNLLVMQAAQETCPCTQAELEEAAIDQELPPATGRDTRKQTVRRAIEALLKAGNLIIENDEIRIG